MKGVDIYIYSNLPLLSIEVWDITGKLISSMPGLSKKHIKLEKNYFSNPGTYFITIRTKENTIVEKLLVF